jgi:MFS family permease
MFSPFYASVLVWNLAHGMTNVLVPLYALHLGLSGVAIGSLVALPVVLQILFNLLGGIYVDRLGAKNVLYLACWASLAASAAFNFSNGFTGLFLGQCLFVLSRASFWPANWSLASELPGERSINLGRVNSVDNTGQIAGTAIAGVVISAAGYREGFIVTGAIALAALALTSLIRHSGKRRCGPYPGIVATYSGLARQRPMYFAMACAFLSVLPFTVTASFHPVLLVAEGYGSTEIGWLISLRAIGAIFAGIALASLVRSARDLRVPFWCCVVIALGLGASALFPGAWPMGISLFVLGITSGLTSVYFQLLISADSKPEERGSAMSYGGLGWNISNMSAPLVMGMVMDALGIHAAFYVMAALLFGYALMLSPLYRWAHGVDARLGARQESR